MIYEGENSHRVMPAYAVLTASYMFLSVGYKVSTDSAWKGKLNPHVPYLQEAEGLAGIFSHKQYCALDSDPKVDSLRGPAR